MFGLGINRKLIERNPIRHITGKRDLNIKKNKTVRVLQDDELSLIFKICDESRTSLRNVLFLKLCLFYGNRYSELRLARKSDFDLVKIHGQYRMKIIRQEKVKVTLFDLLLMRSNRGFSLQWI